jgi:hypothetical protein
MPHSAAARPEPAGRWSLALAFALALAVVAASAANLDWTRLLARRAGRRRFEVASIKGHGGDDRRFAR